MMATYAAAAAAAPPVSDREGMLAAAARQRAEEVDCMFGAIAAGSGGDEADAAADELPPPPPPPPAPPRRARRWGELVGRAQAANDPVGGDNVEDARAAAQEEHRRATLEAAQLGVLAGWRAYVPEGRKRGALAMLEGAQHACEICRWEHADGGSGALAELNAQYERYASGGVGRAGMWERLAATYNARMVHAYAHFGGALIEAWERAVGRRPRAVSAAECHAHFTQHCGTDIVRPHREQRLFRLQRLFDQLDDALLVVPRGAAAAAAPGVSVEAHVNRETAKLMLSTAAAIERTEKLVEATRRGGPAAAAPASGGGGTRAPVARVHEAGVYEDP